MKVFIVVLGCLALSGFASACGGHDSVCHGNNGAQGDCCGGMHCQKNDPSWAEGRCYYNPGSGDEDASSSSISSSSSSTSSLPKSSCDSNIGIVCIPDACEKRICTLMPDAKCLADRCGCEARFFRWNAQEKAFQDYSRLCHIAEHLTKVERFVNESQVNDEASASRPVDLHAVAEQYRTFNKLLVEILLDMARYLTEVVKTDPTETTVAKLRKVHEDLQSLRSSAKGRSAESFDDEDVMDEDAVEERRLSKWIKLGGKLIKKFLDDEVPSASDVQNSDSSNVSERAIFDWLKKGAKLVGKVVKNLADEKGQFADEISSGKVAVSDRNVRDDLKLQERKLFNILKKIVKTVKKIAV